MKKFLILLLVLLAIAGVVEIFFFRQVTSFTKIPPREEKLTPAQLLLNANELPFRSEGGTNLSGWLIHGKAGYPVIVIAHPYGSNRSQILGMLEPMIAGLNKNGYFIFLFDFRGHGKSTGASWLGYKEAEDLSAALQAILKFRQVERRVGVLGIGMGAIAAIEACRTVDEVKLVLLDSVYTDIPGRTTEELLNRWPFLKPVRTGVMKIVDLNLQRALSIPATDLRLEDKIAALYPKPVLLLDKNPPRPEARKLYEAAREPKELLQFSETAAGELIGEAKERYNIEIMKKIQEHLPAVSDQPTLNL